MKAIRIHIVVFSTIVMLLMTDCNHGLRRYGEAKDLYEEGLAFSEADQTVAAAESYNQALMVLGHCDQGNPDVLRLKGQIEDELGTCCWKHGMKEEALRLHQDAIELFRSLPGSVLLMDALRNAGEVAASLHQMDEAEEYYEEALRIAKTQSDKKIAKNILLKMSHDVYLEKGEYDKTVKMVTDAIEGGARPDLCHLTLGLAYRYMENDDLAIEHLNLASQSETADVRMPAYQGLYQIYEQRKDYPEALRCFQNYNENMMQAQGEQYVEELQRVKWENDLQKQKENVQLERKRKSIYLYFVLGLLVVALMVVFLLLLYKHLKAKLKEKESQTQLQLALEKNKVFVTALALSEKIIGNTVDFDFKEKEWNDYLELIDLVYSDFTQKLLVCYPTLTKTDLQICSLTRQGFSNQVISIMMNLQTNSYARRKYRIKQDKMNGDKDDRSFEEIINGI